MDSAGPGGRRTSRPVRRILCPASRAAPAAAIHLGLPLPAGSSGLPAGSGGQPSNACAGRRLAATALLGLAPGGVYRATPVTRGAGGLLPHRFTLTGPMRSAVCFLWHCPAGHPGLPLTTTLPCGVRTFLGGGPKAADATARPTRPSRTIVRVDAWPTSLDAAMDLFSDAALPARRRPRRGHGQRRRRRRLAHHVPRADRGRAAAGAGERHQLGRGLPRLPGERGGQPHRPRRAAAPAAAALLPTAVARRGRRLRAAAAPRRRGRSRWSCRSWCSAPTAVLAFQDRLRAAGRPPARHAAAAGGRSPCTRWSRVGAVYGGYFGAALGVMLVAGLGAGARRDAGPGQRAEERALRRRRADHRGGVRRRSAR